MNLSLSSSLQLCLPLTPSISMAVTSPLLPLPPSRRVSPLVINNFPPDHLAPHPLSPLLLGAMVTLLLHLLVRVTKVIGQLMYK